MAEPDAGSVQPQPAPAPLWPAQPISRCHAIALGIAIGVVLVILLLLLCQLWPAGNLANGKWDYPTLSGFRLFSFVAVWGALGGIVHVVMSYGLHFVQRDFSSNWVPWYIFRPIEGGLVGAIAFYALTGGVVGSGENASSLDKTIAISALAGMFSPQVVEKFRQVASTLFSPPAQRQSASQPLQKPAVDPLPNKPIPLNADGSVAFALAGKSFVAGATSVRIGATKLDDRTLTVTPTRIEVKLDKTAAASFAGKKHKLVVANPAPAGDADPIDIEFAAPQTQPPKLTAVAPKEIDAGPAQKLTLTGSDLSAVKEIKIGPATATIEAAPARSASSITIALDASALPKGSEHPVLLDAQPSGQKVKVKAS